jgi:4-amino-4-deoxychorismate lyase
MYRFIESIKVQHRGFQHMEWHNKRFNETRRVFFPSLPEVDLAKMLVLPETIDEGIYKCRVVYGLEIEEVTYQPYRMPCVRSLRLVDDKMMDYSYKYEDRDGLQKLLTLKGDADDILIVRDGCIVDTSYSNVALFDGSHWYTPETFLLNGTCRQRLLAEGILREAPVTLQNLFCYEEVRPINAMLELYQTPSVRVIF